MFRTSEVDVWYMDSFWSLFQTSTLNFSTGHKDLMSGTWTKISPHTRHQVLMSCTWTDFLVHVPNIKISCLVCGRGRILKSVSRTSNFDVWHMDVFFGPCPGHCPRPGHRATSGTWTGGARGLDPNCLLFLDIPVVVENSLIVVLAGVN